MIYERVTDGQGPGAIQRREVNIDVTDATAGQVIAKSPDGRWRPHVVAGDGSGVDYGADLAALVQRVNALEADQVRLYVGDPDTGYEQVSDLWIDPETGDVSVRTED